jgi:hypothetical protein
LKPVVLRHRHDVGVAVPLQAGRASRACVILLCASRWTGLLRESIRAEFFGSWCGVGVSQQLAGAGF